MKNIIDLIPADAITVADTSEYAAWMSKDATEVWINPKAPEGFVTKSHFLKVIEKMWSDGFYAEKVTVPDSAALISPDGTPCKEGFDIGEFVTDFGNVTLVDLKRQSDEERPAPKLLFRLVLDLNENGEHTSSLQVHAEIAEASPRRHCGDLVADIALLKSKLGPVADDDKRLHIARLMTITEDGANDNIMGLISMLTKEGEQHTLEAFRLLARMYDETASDEDRAKARKQLEGIRP